MHKLFLKDKEQPDLRVVHNIRMTAKEWISVPDNPIQRDTQMHAEKALRSHLSKSSPTHARVAMAELPGGSRYKLDGHTRAYLWESGRLEPPDFLMVDVYPVKNMDDVKELYKHFDNPSAAENAIDRLHGAYRLHHIEPISNLLKIGGITTAFKTMPGAKPTIYENVGSWKEELIWLDSIPGTTTENMPAAIILAALLTCRKRGPRRVTTFWQDYVAKQGCRIEGRSDGVDTLVRLVDELRARRMLSHGRPAVESAAAKAVSCVESWISGRTYATHTAVKPTDIKSYVATYVRKGFD